MKNLETLINELCPEGVEFVKLVKYATVQYGYPFDSKLFSEDEKFIPLIRIRDVLPAKPSTYYSGEYLKEYIVTKGDMLVGMDGNFNMEKWNNRDGLLNQRVCKIYTKDETILLDGFLYHYLRPLFKKIENSIQGSTVKHLSAKVINKIEIPLPPIEVQTEIVRILDKFTSLEAELEAELDCRKRQYEYYRDKLLSFDNVEGQEIEWKKMSEVSFYPKTRIDASELSDNSYIGVENLLKDKLGRTDSTVKPEGSVIQFVEKDILIGNIRPYLRKIWKSDCKGGTNGDVLCIRVKEPSEVSADYLFHILSSEKFFLYDIKNSKGAKMPRGDKSAVMDFEIPIPSLEEQHRIVSILDRFESLTTSLQSGLPAEITARRQQYEHYRDKLLTFKRKGAA